MSRLYQCPQCLREFSDHQAMFRHRRGCISPAQEFIINQAHQHPGADVITKKEIRIPVSGKGKHLTPPKKKRK